MELDTYMRECYAGWWDRADSIICLADYEFPVHKSIMIGHFLHWEKHMDDRGVVAIDPCLGSTLECTKGSVLRILEVVYGVSPKFPIIESHIPRLAKLPLPYRIGTHENIVQITAIGNRDGQSSMTIQEAVCIKNVLEFLGSKNWVSDLKLALSKHMENTFRSEFPHAPYPNSFRYTSKDQFKTDLYTSKNVAQLSVQNTINQYIHQDVRSALIDNKYSLYRWCPWIRLANSNRALLERVVEAGGSGASSDDDIDAARFAASCIDVMDNTQDGMLLYITNSKTCDLIEIEKYKGDVRSKFTYDRCVVSSTTALTGLGLGLQVVALDMVNRRTGLDVMALTRGDIESWLIVIGQLKMKKTDY